MAAGNCQRCGLFRKWLHRHHVKPRAEGGTDADGIELICANCHEDEHDSPFGQSIRARRRRAQREAEVPPAELRRLYVDEVLSIRQIADRLGTAASNVEYWLKDYDIERRPAQRRRRFDPSREELSLMYTRMTLDEIAAHFGVSRESVRLAMKRLAVPVRRRGEQPQGDRDDAAMATEIERALAAADSATGAAAILDIPPTTLAGRMKRLGIVSPHGRQPTRREVERAYADAGFRIQGLADRLSVSYSTANRWLTEYGITRRGKAGRPAAVAG